MLFHTLHLKYKLHYQFNKILGWNFFKFNNVIITWLYVDDVNLPLIVLSFQVYLYTLKIAMMIWMIVSTKIAFKFIFSANLMQLKAQNSIHSGRIFLFCK